MSEEQTGQLNRRLRFDDRRQMTEIRRTEDRGRKLRSAECGMRKATGAERKTEF